jgi:hypothetical protein
MIRKDALILEGLSTETKPAFSTDVTNGNRFFETDTGETYTMTNGVWVLTNTGSTVVRTTKVGHVETDKTGCASVEYATPFLDTEYAVLLCCQVNEKELVPLEELEELKSERTIPIAHAYNITASGFDIQSLNAKTGLLLAGAVVSWIATRNYNP